MNYFYFLIKSAIGNFTRNKIRTFLTSLGILIGVFSVVFLIALGVGLKNYLSQQFENLGANLIIIFPGNVFNEEAGGFAGGFGPGLAGGADFDERDYNALKKVNEADFVVPVFFKSLRIKSDEDEGIGYVQGANEEIFEVLNLEPIEGDVFSKADVNSRAKVGVLGSTLASNLFENPEASIGKYVRINSQRFKVIGLLDAVGDPEQDNSITVPYKSTFGSLNPEKTFFTIYLGVKSEDLITQAKERAEEVLLKRYKEDDFSVVEQSEILDIVNQIFAVVNGILLAIGSISLIVGGIGIMNIMYATVTERTKEIGIRRAVGATKRDILLQFLTESVLLSLFGGTIGLILATLAVILVQPFFPLGINVLAVFVAFGVSTFIGVFFGVFPARRASGLTPIEAIRYE